MSRFSASRERKPSEVPSGAYNGIRSRLEDTGVLDTEGKEFLESPVSRAEGATYPLNIRNGIHSSTVNVSSGSQTPQHTQSEAGTLFRHARARTAAGSGKAWTCAVERRPPRTAIPPANMSRWSEAAARMPNVLFPSADHPPGTPPGSLSPAPA